METRAQLAFEACEKLFSICKLKFYWSFSDIINQHFKYHPHFDVVNMKCDWDSQMWGVWDWKEKNAGTWRRAASFPTIWKFWSRVKTFLSLINLDCMVLLCRLFAKKCVLFFCIELNVYAHGLTRHCFDIDQMCAPTIMQSQPWHTEKRKRETHKNGHK